MTLLVLLAVLFVLAAAIVVLFLLSSLIAWAYDKLERRFRGDDKQDFTPLRFEVWQRSGELGAR